MNKSSLFTLGFRPFFFLSTLFSVLLMILWVSYFSGSELLTSFDYYSSMSWHAHEMIFGYSMAVVAGFLLTAIKNWTGMQTVNGTNLMLLALLWMLGRVAPFVFNQPWLIALTDMLFLPVLAMFVAIPLVKAGNKRNYFMIFMIVLMSFLNVLVHLEKLGLTVNTATVSYKLAFYIIIALIILMAGRVFPMFSQNGVNKRYQVVQYPFVEKFILPSYFIFVISLLFIQSAYLTTLTALISATLNFIRLKGWYNKGIWQIPLVWILHVGYLFIIIGLVLTAISQFQPSFYFLALHAFSVGTLGVITIGMMARVSVGHTGRDLRNPPKVLKTVFLLMVLSAFVRVFVPMFLPAIYQATIIVSGILWILAFLLFVISYTKILTQPRVSET